MPLNKKSNVLFNDGVRTIAEQIRIQAEDEEKIRIRYVNVWNEGAWAPLIVVAHLAQCEPVKNLVYEGLELGEERPPVKKFLEDLAEGTVGKIQAPGVLDQKRWEQLLLPSDNDYWGGAGMLFSLPLHQNHLSDPSGPLLDYEKPYYSDASEAVREWISIRSWHGFLDGRRGHLLVFIPERRAHFTSIQRVSETGVSIKVARKTADAVKIKGAWFMNNRTAPIDAAVDHEDTMIDVPVDASRVELFLIGQDNTIFDYRRETALGFVEHEGRMLGLGGTSESARDLLQTIQKGENQQTEFKEFVNPDDKGGPDKLSEMMETVIAFANTGGGIVIIGVTDNGDIVGITRPLNKWSSHVLAAGVKKSQEELTEIYRQSLQRRIMERIRPSPSIKIEGHEVMGSLLTAIIVEAGQEKPYQDIQTKIVYVRHGASNRKPEKEELKELCCGAAQNPWGQALGGRYEAPPLL